MSQDVLAFRNYTLNILRNKQGIMSLTYSEKASNIKYNSMHMNELYTYICNNVSDIYTYITYMCVRKPVSC